MSRPNYSKEKKRADPPKRNAELEATGNETAQLRGCCLGLEDGDEARGRTDAETGQQPADADLAIGRKGRALDGDTEHEDEDEDQAGHAEAELRVAIRVSAVKSPLFAPKNARDQQ